MLTLTKHIGQLWYAYPMAVASVLLMAGILGKNIIAKRKSKRILGTTVISFALLLCIQHITMWYLRIQNPVSIGRQGAYRIREMPYNKMNARDKEALIQHYTGGSNDPMLRPTFESMFVTRPWGETYYRVDSILKARHITGRDADDCLNAAFKAYMLHMEHYGWQSAMHDLDWSLNLEHIANCIITVNTLSLFDKNYFPGPLQSKWSGSFSHEKYQKISSFCNSEWLETFTPFTLHSLMVICFLLLPISLLKLRWQQALLIILPVAFAWFVMFINCIITVYILRYVLASYMEAYMVMALLLTIIVSPKKQLAGE